jgi:hypothetical protein
MNKVINHQGVELKVGDRIKIISEKLQTKTLANVSEGEIITITSFSEDGKIIYHHNTLALPTFSDIYTKIN